MLFDAKKLDSFFLGDQFRAKSRHGSLERGLIFRAGVFHAHVMNSEGWAVIKAAHTIHTFSAVNRQSILHVNIPHRTDLRAALAGGAGFGVNRPEFSAPIMYQPERTSLYPCGSGMYPMIMLAVILVVCDLLAQIIDLLSAFFQLRFE